MTHAIDLGSRRVLQPGKWRWLRAIVWAVLIGLGSIAGGLIPAVVIFLVAGAMSGTAITNLQSVPGPWLFLAMLVWAVGALATYAGLVRAGEERRPTELAVSAALPELAIGLAIGGAMMAVTVLLLRAGGWITLTPTPVTSAWRWLALAVQSGPLEELVFRGILLRLLWRAFGPWAALAISAAVFGAGHILNPDATWFAAVCIMIEAGIMLAGFYILTGRLWVSIGMHAGWNFTQGWVFGAAVSGLDLPESGPFAVQPVPGSPDFLSGGGFGPEASLAALAVGTAVGALTLWLAWKRGRLTEPQLEPAAVLPAAPTEAEAIA